MTKRARLRKKLQRHVRRDLEQDFSDLLVYGMIVKTIDAKGKVSTLRPIME